MKQLYILNAERVHMISVTLEHIVESEMKKQLNLPSADSLLIPVQESISVFMHLFIPSSVLRIVPPCHCWEENKKADK